MGTKRIKIQRSRNPQITDEAIAAYQAGDHHALHHALGLRPWDASPLPHDVEPLGVDADPPGWVCKTAHELARWNKALKLQRRIEAAIAEKERKS